MTKAPRRPRRSGENRPKAGRAGSGAVRRESRNYHSRGSVRVSSAWREKIEDLLRQAERQGVGVDPGSASRLEAYCRAVVEWSERAGLVSPGDLGRFVEKHVAAGLGPLLLLKPAPEAWWIDVGTGAGLPGLVMKLCCPDVPVTLVESSRKKTIFLERVRETIGLTSLDILEARVESLTAWPSCGGRPRREAAGRAAARDQGRALGGEAILMRAVAALAPSLALIDVVAPVGCNLITFKGLGWKSELEAARPAMLRHGWAFVEMREIPWVPARMLLLVRERLTTDATDEGS